MECSKAWWSSEEKTHFHRFPLPPQQILLKPSISLFDFKVLFYHGLRPLLMHFLHFLRSINYDFTFQCNKSSTPLSIWFWLKHWFLSFPWDYGVAHGNILQAPSCTSKWKIAFEIISGFDLNATSLWWRTWNSKGVRSSWSWTPSNLVLSYFFKLSHLGDLVASRPHF